MDLLREWLNEYEEVLSYLEQMPPDCLPQYYHAMHICYDVLMTAGNRMESE